MRKGDVITHFDGASVEGRRVGHLGVYLRKLTAGAEVVLERRDDSKITIVAASTSD